MVQNIKNIKNVTNYNILTNIIFILLIIFAGLIVFYMIKQIFIKSIDKFSDISKLLERDGSNNESYNKCVNENDQLSYVTNGKYNNCSKMLAELAKSGIDASADIGFGKITEICPYSSMASSPSECLTPKLNNQNKLLEDTAKLLNKNPEVFQMQKMSDDMELKSYSNQLDKLYKNDKINSAAKYIKSNKKSSSDKAYNDVLTKYIPTPSKSN
jgi:hypothetical protein